MIVLLAGPDGIGKSTIADRLAGAITVSRREHFRPRHSGGPVVTSPHDGGADRGLLASLAKILFLWAEQLSVLRARSVASESGLVLIERGWWDQLVDPRRYRLDPRALWLTGLLGNLLPRADLGVLLVADPGVVHARKPELDEEQITEQLARWKTNLPRAARRQIEVATDIDPNVSFSQLMKRLPC